MRSKQHFFIILLLSGSMILCGCTPATANASARDALSTHAAKQSLVKRQAALFMRRFRRRDFGAEWKQLSPAARHDWPSRSARTSALSVKFAREAILSAFVGTPVRAGRWVNPEDPAVSVGSTWRVPVGVHLRANAGTGPPGVQTLYRHLDLYLSFGASGQALIDGEGPAALDAPIVDPSRPPSRTVHMPILMYHRVGAYPSPRAWTNRYGYEIERGLTVTTRQFDGEMRYLSMHGYHAISLPRLADALLYGLPLPSHPVALTFDDGRQSPWFHAIPALRRYGFTATFFVCSGFVGQTNETVNHLNVQHYLTWNQVTRLAQGGFWVEDHGQKDINALWGLPLSLLRAEVQGSASVLTAHTHQPIQFIAYTGALWPYPDASQAGPLEWSLFAHLRAFGYVGAAVDARIPTSSESSSQLFQLPRVRVSPGETLPEFAASLGGRGA